MRRACLAIPFLLAAIPVRAAAAPALVPAPRPESSSTASAAPAASTTAAAPSSSSVPAAPTAFTISPTTAPAAPVVSPASIASPVPIASPASTASVPAPAPPPRVREHTLALPSFPYAREGTPLRWDPEWRRFELGDYVLTLTDGALILASAIVKPINTGWSGGILFDNQARNSLRLTSLDARGWAGDTSDVLLSVQMMAPFLIDSLATAWWYRGSADVAQQMALIDAETLSITAAVQGITTTLAGRQRPYVQTCGSTLPSNSLDCNTFSENRSFFSGHTSLSFTSAALVCSHHLNLDMFENGPADEVSCVSALGVAATTGLLRVMSDYHYASDVITGAIMGNAIGFGMPYLLHYRRHKKPGESASSTEHSDFTFHVVPTGTGAAAVGTF